MNMPNIDWAEFDYYSNAANPSRREFAQAVLVGIGADPNNENALNVLGS